MLRSLRWLLVVAPAVAAGCASAPPAAHEHLVAETVTVTARGLEPGSDVHIPSFATVVFRNGLDQGDLEITLERQIGACQGCSTLLRFRQEGAVAVARSLPPQSVATICFHEPGVFAFVARSSAGEQRGRVLVGGGK